MSIDTQGSPRNIPLFGKHGPVWKAFCSALQSNSLLYTIWQIVLEKVSLEEGWTTAVPEALEQERMAWVQSYLESRGIDPMDQLLESIQSYIPSLTKMLGKYAKRTLYQIMLVHLGLLDESQADLRTEHITPENPITIDIYQDDRIQVTIPLDVTGRHLLELSAYFKALRPAKQPGRRPKPRDAPRQRTRGTRDPVYEAECLRAWALHQQDQDWKAIAHDLWPHDKLPTDRKKRDSIRKKIDRRVYTGRSLATAKKLDAKN